MTNIYYFCRINSNADQERFGTPLHIGPAYQKLANVVRALRSAGASVFLVTVPVCRSLKISRSSIVTRCFRENQVPIISLGMMAGRIFNRIYAAFAFFAYSTKVKKDDRVVLYNFFPEYLLAALYLRIIGRPAIVDIEDAPIFNIRSAQSVLSQVAYYAIRLLSREGVITVSHKVAARLALSKYEVVYGASRSMDSTRSNLHKLQASKDKTVHIVYGGSLLPETGVDVFCDAIHMLAATRAPGLELLKLSITGFGSEDKITKLVKDVENIINIDWKGEVPFEKYSALIESAHVGLCLKVPNTEMADTTFPSKVVELLRSKLLLITTPTSDVPALFRPEHCCLLHQPYHESLAEYIMAIATNPSYFLSMADAGIARSNSLFEYKQVGNRLSDFILNTK